MIKRKKLYLSFILISLISSLIFSSCEVNGVPFADSNNNDDNTPLSDAEVLENTESEKANNTLPFQEVSLKKEEPGYISQMDKHSILTFEIKADETAWQTMLDNAEKEEYISADVTINGETIKNVGIRPKGNSSLSSIARDSDSNRYSFKIEFDHYEEGQTWQGLDKLVINNMYSDSSYMKEYFSYDIMEYIGVDVPLYAFADIKVNGEAWGCYLALECYEDSYVERLYDGEGELYKPESSGIAGVVVLAGAQRPQGQNAPNNQNIQNDENVTIFFDPNAEQGKAQANTPQMRMGMASPAGGGEMSQQEDSLVSEDRVFNFDRNAGNRMNGSTGGIDLKYTDDKTESYSAIFNNSVFKCNIADYERVITAIKNLNDGTELEKYVDVDAVLKYFAAHTTVVSLDSYVSGMAHNYYLYENNGQIKILPWDYNMAFGGFQSGDGSSVVNFPIDTPVSGVSLEDRPLIGKLLEVPEYLEKYRSYLAEIINGYFSDGKFEQKVDEINSLISEYVKNDPTAFSTPEEYEKAVAAFRELGKLRAQSIQGQLDGTIPSTTEAQNNAKDKLIDASSVNMSDLGSMGGGMFNIRRGEDGGEIEISGGAELFGNMNPDTMFEAFEVINSAENGVLNDEQRQKLHDMGLTDEQIEEFMKVMPTRR